MYTLSLDQNFAPFLDEHFRWNKKSAADPHRGLASDDDNVPEDRRRTATQKTVQLELMLGQIANFCPVVSRNTIVKTAERHLATSSSTLWVPVIGRTFS